LHLSQPDLRAANGHAVSSTGASPASPGTAELEFRSNWKLLVAAVIGTGIGLPTLPFYSIGIFAPSLAKEFGWSFGSIFGGLAVTTAALLLLGPFIGSLLDRFGTRRIAALSLATMGLAYMTLALSTGSLAQYYGTWLLIPIAGMGATPVAFTRAVGGRFVIRRGLALGITLAGTGLFALFMKPLTQLILIHYGWRVAVVALGALPLVIGTSIVLWGMGGERRIEVRPRPGETDIKPDAASGLTVRQALRTRAFWIMLVVFLPVSFASAGPFPNMENILRSVRLDLGEIVKVTSLLGITIVCGRLIGGWAIDRVWAPLVGATVLTGAAFGSLILAQSVVPYSQALLAIVLLALAAGVEIDLMAYCVARYLGMRSYGAIYGVLYGVFAVGAGLGPSLFGRAFDLSGHYRYVMSGCALVLLMSAMLLLGMGRYPNRGAGSGAPTRQR